MAFIQFIHPDEAAGKLAALYQQISGPGGQVDNVLQAHSLRPHTLQGHLALYKSVLHHPGNHLPQWFLESLGVLVSGLNQCSYCARHHGSGLRRLLAPDATRADALLASLHTEQPGEPFTPAEQAALAYGRKLTLSPGSIGQDDVAVLRTHGYSDGEILEINQVTSYFAYANRTVLGLGVTAAGETLGLSPEPSPDIDDWAHR